jgi:hypothetical protein
MARHGKLLVVGATALVLSVFLLPPLKLLFPPSPAPPATRAVVAPRGTPLPQVPPCPTSPWKPDEDLRGKCPGDLKPRADAASVSRCAVTCCADPACVSWQFRRDTGCLQGGDVRLGQEKDGVRAWCSDHPPVRWQGQFVTPRKGAKMAAAAVRAQACDEHTWNPDEEIGQCFGLGDAKPRAGGSAAECRQACCADAKCGAWQFNRELGCFYSKGMHGCQGGGDPVKLEPFVGRRKQLEGRGYLDKHNKPWQMQLT